MTGTRAPGSLWPALMVLPLDRDFVTRDLPEESKKTIGKKMARLHQEGYVRKVGKKSIDRYGIQYIWRATDRTIRLVRRKNVERENQGHTGKAANDAC